LKDQTEQPTTATKDDKSEENQADLNASTASADSKKILELEAQVKEKENKYLYLYADFENFKKRAIKERSDLIKFGWESVALDLLAVLDNVERALNHAPESLDKGFLEGLKMVHQQFISSLEKNGVVLILTKNQQFDPHFHEALAQSPSNEVKEGFIVKQELSGYTFHGRLLRPAKVIVSSGEDKKSS